MCVVVRISTAVHAHAHALGPLDDRRLLPQTPPPQPPALPAPPSPPDTALPISPPPPPTGDRRADNNNDDDDDEAAAVRHVQAAPAPVCREGSRAVFTSARGRHVSEIFSSTHARTHARTHIVVAAAAAAAPSSSSSPSSFFGRRISYRRCTRPPPRRRYRRSPFAVDGAAVDRDEHKSIMGGMDTDQLYSVRWNEFHTSIITSFRHLLDQEDFIDVTIACDGHSFTAHKVVLSACSPYFRSLLKANPCQHPIVILRDVKKQEMEALLSFMYNGEVRINQEHLPEFLKTARSLQVRGLVDFTKENQPSSWGSSSVVPVDVVGKNKASDNLPSPPYKRQRNNSEQLTTQPLTPSSSYNAERDKDTPSLLVQALELNQSQSSQNKNTVDSSVTGHSSDEEDSNSGDSDGSHTVHDNTRSDVNQQNSDIVIQPQISQAQHSKLEPVDFLSSSGNNHDLHNTSISIEQQSRHSFPTSISSGVSIISSLQGLPGLLPGPSGIHNNSQENNYARRSIEMTRVRATDPRPCPKCGKIYRSAHTLRTHLEDKHTVCSGYRCVLCGTVAKSRNSLHSHMSRQHRGISTKDLPVQPMPSNFDPELASNLLLKAGVKVSPAELRARASPTDAVTTSHRRGDGKLDLQSANSSVCGGDDPEDLTVNSSGHHQQSHHNNNNNHHHQQYGNNNNNNQQRYSDSQQQQLLQQHQHHLLNSGGGGKFPTAMDLIDNYARVGGGGGGGSGGGALSPFLPAFAACGKDLQSGDSKLAPYNNKAFLDSYLKALVETNPPLFYASKIAGDMIKHEIAPDDADYSSASDEDDIDEDDIDEDVDEDVDDEDDDDRRRRRGHSDGGAASSVNDTPLPLQAGKN